jgi:internalin A
LIDSKGENVGVLSARRLIALALASFVSASGCNRDDASKAPVDSATPTTPVASASAPTLAAKPGCPATVDFHGNGAFEAAVRESLGKGGTGPIATTDLASIVTINLTPVTTNELDPCFYPLLTSAQDLFLGPGNLEDVSLLAPLTGLRTLQIYINRVSDITPLAKMTQMERLDLEHTKVQDITPLAKMTSLTQLQLDDTPVNDITPLAGLTKLERLSLRNTKVTDLSPLKNLTSLRSLAIEGSPIADVNALSALEKTGLKVVKKGRF